MGKCYKEIFYFKESLSTKTKITKETSNHFQFKGKMKDKLTLRENQAD